MVPVLQDLPLPLRGAPLVALRAPLWQEMGSSSRNDEGGGRSHELRRVGKVGVW